MESVPDKPHVVKTSSNLQVAESSSSLVSEIDIVSSCDPERIRNLFSSFNSEKASLLRSTGFGGLLNLPVIKNLNPHFSLWLLSRFNEQTSQLDLDNGVRIPLTDVDIGLIFYIPCHGRIVDFAMAPTQETINAFVDKILGRDPESSLTMSFLEQILLSDIGPQSSRAAKDAFKIACVMCSIHYLLAPELDLEFPSALIRNFLPPVNTKEINWASYVIWTLRRASVHARRQITEGRKKFSIYGCVIALQVFYLDNLNFGPLTPYHTVFPRVAAYSPSLMEALIQEDFTGTSVLMFNEFGRRDVRDCREVVYTRGWNANGSTPNGNGAHGTLDYISLIGTLSQVLKVIEQLAEQVNKLKGTCNSPDMSSLQSTRDSYQHGRYILKETIHQLSTTAAEMLRFRHINMFQHVISPPKPLLQKRVNKVLADLNGTKRAKFADASASYSVVEGFLRPTEAHRPQAAFNKYASASSSVLQGYISSPGSHPLTKGIILSQPVLQKQRVLSHSEFPLSCFELGLCHPEVSRRWKGKTYRWMLSAQLDELNREWILFSIPRNISLTGNEVVHSLQQNGEFTLPLVDSIMLIWNHLDAKVYKRFEKQLGIQKRWRHFLPASFAEEVIGNPYYLKSNVVKSSFLGAHITYDIPNCQQIVAPVRFNGTWSCYFWDFRHRSISVLDPLLMGSIPEKTMDKHSNTVFKLHQAIMECKDRFFSGWDIAEGQWTPIYNNDVAGRSRLYNTGLHAVHYARSFCGQQLHFCLKHDSEQNLSEARGELLYHIFTCPHNIGYKPYIMFPAIQESLN